MIDLSHFPENDWAASNMFYAFHPTTFFEVYDIYTMAS